MVVEAGEGKLGSTIDFPLPTAVAFIPASVGFRGLRLAASEAKAEAVPVHDFDLRKGGFELLFSSFGEVGAHFVLLLNRAKHGGIEGKLRRDRCAVAVASTRGGDHLERSA